MALVQSWYDARAAAGIDRYQIQVPTRRCRRSEQAGNNRIKDAPKYLVRAQAAISTPLARKGSGLPESIPCNQKMTAQTQRASIMTSHITPVAETRKPGAKSVAAAASVGAASVGAAIFGDAVKRSARRYVPKTRASAGRRKPMCHARSDQPATIPT